MSFADSVRAPPSERGSALPTTVAAPVALLFAQMLPATLVAPAVRPLLAANPAAGDGVAHAFMAVNMLGAAAAAPWVGVSADRASRPRAILLAALAVDAAALLALSFPVAAPLLLAVRTIEGAAHVGGSTLLLREIAARGGAHRGPAMGWAASAIMCAVALGSAAGGVLVGTDPRAPFWAAALLQTLVGLSLLRAPGLAAPAGPAAAVGPRAALRATFPALAAPVAAAFAGRFAIGCIVVTFALFAHRVHGFSDRAIGYLFSAFTIPFALASAPIARLTRSVPRSLVLASGLAAHAVLIAALGWAPRESLAAVMAAAGLAGALVFVSTLGYAAELAPASGRGAAMAVVSAAGALGMLAGPTVAGVLSAVLRDPLDPARAPRVVFLVAGGSHLVLLAASARWLARRRAAERAATRGPGSGALNPDRGAHEP